MASILQKPEPRLPSGIRMLDSVVASRLSKVQHIRYVALSGLEFCDILNGAVVDAMTILNPFQGSIGTKNPTQAEIVKLIDGTAKNAYSYIFDIYSDVNPAEAKRYACYATAEGSNPTANLTETAFTRKLDATNYFYKVLPAIKKSDSIIPGKRRKYKVAFLIMVHEEQGIHQLKMLVDILDDGTGLILIHVDKESRNLYRLVDDFIKTRSASPVKHETGNVFLAQYRFSNIWGHISLVYTQLSGYFELRDIADWDYVINLSNYDWPLRRTNEIHRILELHRGHSYIDFWSDTEALAHRIMRPHLGSSDFKKNFHPPELSITAWPFPYWQTFKQMQWMILSVSAVDHFRNDRIAHNYMAMLEHAFMPEETFFATVLVNSPVHRHLLIPDKKRYVREAGSASWIGWKDRYIFPPGSTDPQFLFLRPFNAYGDFFGETKLMEWIQTNHLDLSSGSSCQRDQLGYRDECIREIVSSVADGNELVVVPVNKAFLEIAANLRCSLHRVGIDSVLHWAMDVEAHDTLIAEGYTSYFVPDAKNSPGRHHYQDKEFTDMLRTKPLVLQKLIDAGFNVWMLDADTIAMRDFRIKSKDYVKDPFNVDIILSIANTEPVPATYDVVQPPSASTGMMYLRSTEGTREFLNDVARRLELDLLLDDQDAVRQFISQSKHTTFTGVGTKAKTDLYPAEGENLEIAANKTVDAEELEIGPVPKSEPTNKGGNSLADFFSFVTQSTQSKDIPKIRVHFFDQLEFVNGQIYYHNDEMTKSFNSYRVIHASGEWDPKQSMQSKDLWFLDSDGVCSDDVAPAPVSEEKN
ncbi:nucleotide-diphospho-sugar transferase-domain-containing protein [Globomyces pollinis-pini]|nr:nucleotide-diphospho-sugar transferase-domain-containing protein [Globomyces pollinis-pini]